MATKKYGQREFKDHEVENLLTKRINDVYEAKKVDLRNVRKDIEYYLIKTISQYKIENLDIEICDVDEIYNTRIKFDLGPNNYHLNINIIEVNILINGLMLKLNNKLLGKTEILDDMIYTLESVIYEMNNIENY
ncbi:MAG: hypothetical protein R3262_11235 [Xanthomarina gelatinilytica]|nr:hypothetical protein [Xanthomarina gelatinilytica]